MTLTPQPVAPNFLRDREAFIVMFGAPSTASPSFSGGQVMTSIEAFGAYVQKVRIELDARLAEWTQNAVNHASPLGAPAREIVVAAGDLTRRGGKRVRSALLRIAFEGCGGSAAGSPTLMAEVAFELLQTYLLIHDDWMDGDEVRRGGPSVHVMLRSSFPGTSDAAGVLAGDYVCAAAQHALLEVAAPAQRLVDASRAFAQIHRDVVLGQALDIAALSDVPIERIHALKTATYTVTGPLEIGAILAGASRETRDHFVRFGLPLGIAFQLRDDLLSMFGAPEKTGKPQFTDIRQGKRTSLIAEVSSDAEACALLPNVFGVPNATEEAVVGLVARVEASGARARVEARLRELLAESRRELTSLSISPTSKELLEGAIVALGERAS